MEVEVKLRLPDSASLQTLSSLLSPFLLHTHQQHNFFFTGAGSRRAVRLRFYGDGDNPSRCVVTLKSNAVLVDGVKRVEEDEEDLDHSIGRAICEDPCSIASVESRVLRRVREEFGAEDGKFVSLGGFKNLRKVYQWKGLNLEVDETLFAFGTLFEIECESVEPERAKEMIESFLRQNEIRYSYSTMSKFAIFRAGKLPSWPMELKTISNKSEKRIQNKGKRKVSEDDEKSTDEQAAMDVDSRTKQDSETKINLCFRKRNRKGIPVRSPFF